MKHLFVLVGIFFSCSAFSQGILEGVVVGYKDGEPVPFVTLAIYQAGSLIAKTDSDFEGCYSINILEEGIFEVEFSSTGFYSNRVVGVELCNEPVKFDAILDYELATGPGIIHINVPVVDVYNPTQGIKFNSFEIRRMPFR